MRNRVMLAAGTLAIVPTLLFAQQRPAQQPAQRPAQRPPAAQPAQRPAPAPAHPMMAGARDGTWELSAGVDGIYLDNQIVGRFKSDHIAPGGAARIGYNINEMWNVSVGVGLGFASPVTLVQPLAAITWTPDINRRTSPFVTAGLGLSFLSGGGLSYTSQFGAHVGVGLRHMLGESIALRVEAREQYDSFKEFDNAVFNGTGIVGLSLFVGGKKILTHIAVNPGMATLASLRATQQFSAIAHDQKGRPMSGKMFTWRSSNPAVATVSNTGVVTAVGDGSATISAMSEGVTGSANVMVSRTAAAVAVAPTSVSLNALGATQQLTATARDQGNSPLTGVNFTWTSSNPAVASVSPAGLVTAVGNGTATITGNSSGKTATATVTVAQMTTAVNVTPVTSSLTAAGATSQLAAQAMDANGRPINGKTYTWTSDAAGVATVSGTGLATAIANGVAHVTAAADGKTGSAIVTVVIATKAAPAIELPAVNASMVLRNVSFRSNSAILLPAAMADLDKVAITMQGMPNSRWEIGGYTSNTGSVARNTRLSGQRADAVKAYLVRKGVDTNSLTTMGYGPERPIANNRTAAGRRQNMRVEIKRLR